MYLCDCGDIYDFNRFCFKNWSHKNPIWDLILIYITEFSIKSCACTQIFRPVKKIFSRISSYLLWDTDRKNLNFDYQFYYQIYIPGVAPKSLLAQKYAFTKKSTIFTQSLRNLAKIIYTWVGYFDQVSYMIE